MPADQIAAAGGVPWQWIEGELRLGVVHRARYDDWSFPKGKLRYGEPPLLAAVREVTEETGLSLVVGRRLPPTSYHSVAGLKTVDYWSMLATGEFVANDETDDLEWLTPDQSADRLTYADDESLVKHLLAVSLEPVRVLLVRHARAGASEEWSGPDDQRPLDHRGVAEARALADVLPVFCPDQVASADPVRCLQTVQPLAERLGLPVRAASVFGEERYLEAPGAALNALVSLLGAESVTALCSQGGVIPDLLGSLVPAGVPVTGVSPGRRADWLPARKGSVWALTARGGRVLSADYYPAFLA
ncbi:MAG: NUDIX hydrolase [Geodermatophilaceae bacterium]|nr:NUDIX hydrolase [Geodermatophilaceae bacterium]